MKRTASTVALALAAAAVFAVIITGVFLGHIVKKSIGVYGPLLTQTTVVVDAVHLSLLTGSAKITGLVVGNPVGYKTPRAMSVGTIVAGVDPTSVFSRKIVIRSLRVESPEIIFEGGLAGNNLSQILNHANSTSQGSGTLSASAEKTFEVDDVVISGAKVQVVLPGVHETAYQVMPLPEIHLTNLGTSEEGITAADLTRRVLSAISSTTVETVARAAGDLDKNAATLKQTGVR